MNSPAPTVQVYITLGSNIAPERNLTRALQMLRQNHHLRVCRVSPVYHSPAVGADGAPVPDQPPFLNAAAHLTTDYYSAFSLKYNVLRFIERCLGRVRTADRFAPRPLDLDIALYGDCVIDLPHLTIPDPDVLRRAYVALPLADIAPDVVHPVTGQTLAAIAEPFRGAAGITRRDDLDLNA